LHNGLGLHLQEIPITTSDANVLRPKLTLIAEHTYTISIASAQLSLVVLYWRVFQPVTGKRGFVLRVMGSFVIVWLVARVRTTRWFLVLSYPMSCWLTRGQIFISIFQCVPPQAYWDKTIGGHCPVDTAKYLIGSVASHLVLDLALMVFPACKHASLQLESPRGRRQLQGKSAIYNCH
jgi:hypothetical protein